MASSHDVHALDMLLPGAGSIGHLRRGSWRRRLRPAFMCCTKPGPSSSRVPSRTSMLIVYSAPTDRSTGVIICDQTIAWTASTPVRITGRTAAHPLQGPRVRKPRANAGLHHRQQLLAEKGGLHRRHFMPASDQGQKRHVLVVRNSCCCTASSPPPINRERSRALATLFGLFPFTEIVRRQRLRGRSFTAPWRHPARFETEISIRRVGLPRPAQALGGRSTIAWPRPGGLGEPQRNALALSSIHSHAPKTPYIKFRTDSKFGYAFPRVSS